VDPIVALARHVARVSYDDLPPAAVAATKTFLLDTLGVAIAGSGDPWAPRLAGVAAGWGDGTGATVLGTRRRLPALSAAVVNGYQIHGLEFDCVHEGAVVHPMATLLPALLADVERRGAIDGRRLIAALAVGVDVAAGLGVAAKGAMQFFRPANAGAFGAVAALGALRGLDADALVHAFGILYGHVSGTLQPHVEGSMQLGVQVGFNARGALTAVDLAAAGFAGPREVLEGRYGYFRLFENGEWDIAPVLKELGRTWRITELSHKPFPSGRLTHGVVDGILRLRAHHGFMAHDVDRVSAHVPPLVARLVGRPDMPAPSANYARLCLAFVAATALVRSRVDVPDFRGDALTAADVHEMAKRVLVVPNGNPDENAIVPQALEIELTDGRRFALPLPSVIGQPTAPLSRVQHLAKFRRCWTYGAEPLPEDHRERLVAAVDRLETVGNVRELIDLTVP
jgi:2-methylcitrate dehydratase PrpD